jgi:succinyl-CoA synthetase beta subunit
MAAYAVLAELGVPSAACVELGEDAIALPFPVAVKLLSDQVVHKSDVGGVMLGVTDAASLAAAATHVRAAISRALPAHGAARLLVQQMASGIGEALLGYRVDPVAGPVVLLAAGGVATEIYRDRAIRLAPVDLATAHEMIDAVAGFAVLKGFRGRPKGDLDALAAAVVALSRLAVRPELGVVECEINPLIVREQGRGVVAVDACAWLVSAGEAT